MRVFSVFYFLNLLPMFFSSNFKEEKISVETRILCPDSKNVYCNGCQYCPNGQMCPNCPKCFNPTKSPIVSHILCPGSTYVYCNGCQYCPNGQMCPNCVEPSSLPSFYFTIVN